MPKATDTRKPFNLLLSTEELDMLNALKKMTGHSAGSELRSALRVRYSHLICQAPTCGNGTPCFVPHMHRQPAQLAQALNQPPAPGQTLPKFG